MNGKGSLEQLIKGYDKAGHYFPGTKRVGKTQEQYKLSGRPMTAYDLKRKEESDQVKLEKQETRSVFLDAMLQVSWPDKPLNMSPAEAEIWDEVCAVRAEMGLLRAGDGAQIRAFAEAQVDYVKLRAECRATEVMDTDDKGRQVINPAYKLLPVYDTRRRMWLETLGLTGESMRKWLVTIGKFALEREKTKTQAEVEIKSKVYDPWEDYDVEGGV